jgi:F-type H+-transporting ATPase subunit b
LAQNIVFAIALFLIATQAFAQESGMHEPANLDVVGRWKIINSAIFAILLGWFLWKYAPRFFNARSADIQRAIQDATGLKIEAEFRYSEIDRKMATLADQVKKMREQAATELAREHERFRHEAQLEIEHIHHNVTAEAEAFRLEGIQQIRRHTAQLALESAERRLQHRFASGEPEGFLQDFIHLVERGKN